MCEVENGQVPIKMCDKSLMSFDDGALDARLGTEPFKFGRDKRIASHYRHHLL